MNMRENSKQAFQGAMIIVFLHSLYVLGFAAYFFLPKVIFSKPYAGNESWNFISAINTLWFWQSFYVGPVQTYFLFKNKFEQAKGILIVAWLTFIINAGTCAGTLLFKH